jgi:hypothetical protein
MQLDAGDLRHLAVRNLIRRRARPQIKQAPAAAMFVLDGNLESSLLLAGHLSEQTGPQLPGELIAAVPPRDMLAVTGSQVPGGIAALTLDRRLSHLAIEPPAQEQSARAPRSTLVARLMEGLPHA